MKRHSTHLKGAKKGAKGISHAHAATHLGKTKAPRHPHSAGHGRKH